MKAFNIFSAAVLSVLLTGATSALAQEEVKAPPQGPAPQAAPAPEEKPAPERPAQEQKPEPQPEQPQAKPQAQDEKQQQQEQKQDQKEQKEDKQEQKEQQQEQKNDAKNAKPQGGQAGGRIPDDQFRAHFGKPHRFHMAQPVVVAGSPRFTYSGYTFILVDPWPAGWLYTDEFYIDFIDGGYFLCDPLHPGVMITLTVLG